MSNEFLFTSESVSEGHPDKIADQISDAILDEILKQDISSRVACETFVKTGMVLVGGEITTNATIDIENITRQVIKDIGYNSSDMGFDWQTCAVLSAMGKQSPDIAQGVDQSSAENQGAGDQGIMFGYACDETPELMPAPISFAHKLMLKQAQLRKNKVLPWLRPDAKSQVTVRYQNNKPISIDTIVLSTQHHPDISQQEISEAVIEQIIKPSLPTKMLTTETKFLINPTGRFVIGGPLGDCGLTGRKIIVDTYGGMARHGGGCFSGKDPSKVDRSGAYFARYVAKNIVASGLATRCEIQIAYAIGLAEPLAIYVNTFGTGKLQDEEISKRVKSTFNFKPYKIISELNLLQPIYQKTATYGHFGRPDLDLPWEKTNVLLK